MQTDKDMLRKPAETPRRNVRRVTPALFRAAPLPLFHALKG